MQTKTLARDGRVIEETSNVAKEGFAIDSRKCLDGSPDQYAKKPEKAGSNNYTLDDGRTFAEMMPGETAKAHTVGGERRKAMVAENDMYLQASWGEVQFVAKGGLVTFMGDEAIGNNNPCDMVIANGDRKGNRVLTASGYEIRKDLENSGVELSDGAKKFLQVAAEEDRKNPYLPRGKGKDLENRCNLCPAASSRLPFCAKGSKKPCRPFSAGGENAAPGVVRPRAVPVV